MIQLCFFPPLQIHVVRPVLNRIDTLIQTTVNDGQGNTKKNFPHTFNVTQKICASAAECLPSEWFFIYVAASGQGLFHPSWLLCVYQRMFHSENKSLMREGVCHLLELQVLQETAFVLAFSQVFSLHFHRNDLELLLCIKGPSSFVSLRSSLLAPLWMFSLKLHSTTGED